MPSRLSIAAYASTGRMKYALQPMRLLDRGSSRSVSGNLQACFGWRHPTTTMCSALHERNSDSRYKGAELCCLRLKGIPPSRQSDLMCRSLGILRVAQGPICSRRPGGDRSVVKTAVAHAPSRRCGRSGGRSGRRVTKFLEQAARGVSSLRFASSVESHACRLDSGIWEAISTRSSEYIRSPLPGRPSGGIKVKKNASNVNSAGARYEALWGRIRRDASGGIVLTDARVYGDCQWSVEFVELKMAERNCPASLY
ncbi:hypothetical protein GLOTRDRAFT_90352 [Gloeophyllum trabeum ATCC 11539]|uniref:Uncharacterized protein n=1 Tax=Gloeophyllum trabeum (strain ATCC 11539 / FP-39264 / Madison 617) TaxID=670483 RepID=S7S103_GLOTA|nr:uncharacterized protein GLOTRDRAFT_90352 [Gloeophyllum trabeum ATCC 11539]EPQ61055.1 hypothetical protein GLOTRDRAFT_90352 [Gloeophyllum trabeum ATCC 11539]